MSLKIMSWNVNGIRAVEKKGFLDWMRQTDPDILGLQETKASPDQLSEDLLDIPGYHAFWSSAEKKGYSGTVIYTKIKPREVKYGILDDSFNHEGRTIIAEYDDFVFVNTYFPNGKMNEDRLKFKLDFYENWLKTVDQYKLQGKNLIMTGDFNTAHQPIDLSRPKQNEKESGFLPIERQWIDKFLSHGYIDTFRELYPGIQEFTWWNMRTNGRPNNIGWRIDYFYVNEELFSRVKDSFHNTEIMGSDHCPIGIILD